MERFYNSEEIDEGLKCSFCQEQFSDVVKLIPDCGESICGPCHDALRVQVDGSSEFHCQACQGRHEMPSEGLVDNKNLGRMIKRRRIEKPISEEARTLRTRIESLRRRLTTLEAFDARQFVDGHCDGLKHEVSEAVENMVADLRAIERDSVSEIELYRSRCVDNLSSDPGDERTETNEDLNGLLSEMDVFSWQWSGQVFSFTNDEAVETALAQARGFEVRMDSLESRQKKSALSGGMMLFEARTEDYEALKQRFRLLMRGNSLKKFRILETSSWSLTGHSDWVTCVLFLPDGRLASCSDDKTIRIWSVDEREPLFELQGYSGSIYSLAALPDGRLASGSADGTVKIWDLDQRKATQTLNSHFSSVVGLRVLGSGSLVSYSTDDMVRVWDREFELILSSRGHGNRKWIMPFGVLSDDSIVTCSRHNEDQEECVLKVWDAKDGGRLVKSVPTGCKAVWPLLVLFDDRVALGSHDGAILIVDLTGLTEARTRDDAYNGEVSALLQLSNGHLVSCGDDSSDSIMRPTIKVWSLADFGLLQSVATGHNEAVCSMSLSPDERLLATGSWDKRIKLWQISSE